MTVSLSGSYVPGSFTGQGSQWSPVWHCVDYTWTFHVRQGTYVWITPGHFTRQGTQCSCVDYTSEFDRTTQPMVPCLTLCGLHLEISFMTRYPCVDYTCEFHKTRYPVVHCGLHLEFPQEVDRLVPLATLPA